MLWTHLFPTYADATALCLTMSAHWNCFWSQYPMEAILAIRRKLFSLSNKEIPRFGIRSCTFCLLDDQDFKYRHIRRGNRSALTFSCCRIVNIAVLSRFLSHRFRCGLIWSEESGLDENPVFVICACRGFGNLRVFLMCWVMAACLQ